MTTSNPASPAPPPPQPAAAPSAPPSSARPVFPIPLPLPPRLFVPLAAAEGHLAVGTRVTRGQHLAESTAGSATVPVAPAAGTIVGVTEIALLGGGRAAALELEVDPVATAVQLDPAAEQYATPADVPDLIDRLRLAGVRADRRTSPDLLRQLHDAMRRPIDTVLCSFLDAAGGESAVAAAVLRSSAKDVIAGVTALAKVTGANRTWLVVDPGLAGRASAVVRKSGKAPRINVVDIANDYPQADPTLLLYALLGRRLRPDDLPPEVSCVLIDAAAAAAVGRCLAGGAMTDTIVEVRDSRRARSTVFTAAVGTPVRFVLEAAGLGAEPGWTLRAGAALRDVRVGCDAIVAGHEISVDAGPVAPPINPDACIRCGWCVEACPVRIHPAGLLEAAQDNDPVAASRYGLDACVECGICSYVCPSRLPLLASIRELKTMVKKPRAAGME